MLLLGWFWHFGITPKPSPVAPVGSGKVLLGLQNRELPQLDTLRINCNVRTPPLLLLAEEFAIAPLMILLIGGYPKGSQGSSPPDPHLREAGP